MEKNRILSRTDKREALGKLPLVEIAGQNRVLIENHLGVIGYSSEEIQVKVCYGKLSVKGCQLQFMQINKEQLVITGKINAIALCGR